jgi:Transcription factor WhiB
MIEAASAAKRASTSARTHRRCPACGETKPLGDFYPSPSKRGGGLSAYCRPCESAKTREWRAARQARAEAEAAAAEEAARLAEPEPAPQRRRGSPGTPRPPGLPRWQPAWELGLCTTQGSQSRIWTSERYSDQKAAKDACAGCPILDDCRSWAVEASAYWTHGVIYGGMSSAELHQLRRELGTAALAGLHPARRTA